MKLPQGKNGHKLYFKNRNENKKIMKTDVRTGKYVLIKFVWDG